MYYEPQTSNDLVSLSTKREFLKLKPYETSFDLKAFSC